MLRHKVPIGAVRVCELFKITRSTSSLPNAVVNEIANIVGPKNISTAPTVLEQHGRDESIHGIKPSQLVVYPTSSQQVSDVVKCCCREKIPIIPFGTGTGLEGGVLAIKGGVTVDTSYMNNVLKVNENDFDVQVEAGVTRNALNNYLKQTGLWFPVDPGADASLGGMASTSCSGTNAVRYGTMRQNVLNLEVVLPSGNIINTAGPNNRARKTSMGYNLTNLMVGSEGTLGIITKVTLKLYAIPQVISSAICFFPTVRHAVDTAIQILQSNIGIARLELMDEVAMKACNNFNKLNYKELAALFLEFHGSDNNDVKFQSEAVGSIAQSNGGSEFNWAIEIEKRNVLWKARHSIFYACLALKPGYLCFVSDACVPISKLPDLVASSKDDIMKSGLTAPILGHVGDGNFHALYLFDKNNTEHLEKIKWLTTRLAQRALSLGGTCTGEHGIGIGKCAYLQNEIGPEGIDMMKCIKKTLDPNNIMNPDKIFVI